MLYRETRKFAPWENKCDVEDEALVVDLTWDAEERKAIEKLNEEKKARREEGVMISLLLYKWFMEETICRSGDKNQTLYGNPRGHKI